MIRIGEAAKRFDISNRTLRYWEETGVLRSARTENGYRYYDDENVALINHIVLLRKLKMPIAEIERVFIAGDTDVAIDALNGHLYGLKRDVAANDSLIFVIEKLIRHIRASKGMEHVFAYLETQGSLIDLGNKGAPQIQLSERTIPMPEERLDNVRIVRLPPMTVAAYCARSAAPEDDCAKVFDKYVLESGLHKRSGYRHFGFNNPSPSEGNPVYGYEMWVTIPDNFMVPEPLARKQFDGGLYASVSARLNEIGERWLLLYNWCKDNGKYDVDASRQWLEECCMDLEAFTSGTDQQLDLLEPIKLR